MKPVLFWYHAVERLSRGVTKEEVEETVRNPEMDYPTKRKPRRRAIKQFPGRAVHVIYFETPEAFEVVTVLVNPER